VRRWAHLFRGAAALFAVAIPLTLLLLACLRTHPAQFFFFKISGQFLYLGNPK